MMKKLGLSIIACLCVAIVFAQDSLGTGEILDSIVQIVEEQASTLPEKESGWQEWMSWSVGIVVAIAGLILWIAKNGWKNPFKK